MKECESIKKIIFVDSPVLVEAYISNAKRDKITSRDAKELFIAMNPNTHLYLIKKELPVSNTLPFFSNNSHSNALETSRKLVEWLDKTCKFQDNGFNIQYAYRNSFIYYSRFVIHYCLWVIEIVLNSIDKYKPEVISASMSNKQTASSLYVENKEKYLGCIIHNIAESKKIKFEDIAENTNKKSVSASASLIAASKFILKYARFKLWVNLVASENRLSNSFPIFFTTKFYQMDKLAAQIKEKYPNKRSYFLQGPIIPLCKFSLFIKLFWGKSSKIISVQKNLFMELLAAIRKESDFFSYRDISFAHIVADKIRDNIAEHIIELMLWTIKLEQLIGITKPSGLISNGNRADDTLLAELCRQKNIPTILVSHGSHIRPKNEYEKIEWGEHGKAFLSAPFSYLALQSPLAEGYLDVFSSSGKKIKTGPLIWGRPVNFDSRKILLNKILKKELITQNLKVILHAGTSKASKHPRFCVYETSDEYIQTLCELAEAVEKTANTILIIRFRSDDEINIDALKGFLPSSKRVLISVNDSFSDLLSISDLVVSFSSTAIEEALQNRIPVLLYGGGGRYQHIPAFEIESRNSIEPSAVYHVSEANSLERSIRYILNLDYSRDALKQVFDPYIYPENSRVSIMDLLLSGRGD